MTPQASASGFPPMEEDSTCGRLNTWRVKWGWPPPTVEISGSIRPAPGRPVNITLKFSDNRGGTYQEMARITSGADGTFSYSWEAPSNDVFIITADAQGAKSPAVSVGIGGFPGFPLESLLVGYALGLLFAMMRRRQRANRPVFPSCRRSQD